MKRKTTATPSVCHRTHPLLHVGAIALLALLGVVSARVFFDVSAVDIVHFSVLSEESPQSQLPLLCGVIFFELLLLKLHPRTILEVFAPFLLTIPFLWGEPNVNLLIAYIAGVGLSTYRAALIGAFDGATAQKYLRHLPTYGLLLGLLLIALGIFTSTYAYNRMYFSMLDWGVYAQTAWNTFGGEFMRGTYPLPNFSEGHFMPGYFGVMALPYWLLPSVYTVFASGALALWGSAYLLYIFARKRNFPQPYAAAFGIIWLLIPGVTNLNFSIFYGVNAIVFFIPVFFGFYMLYESKRYFWVFTVFLFSLTLKETVGVFWLGWGAVSFLEKRRRDGILYGSIGLIWFLLCIKVFIPYFAGHDYIFYGQFDQSGGGIIDIILSPFTRPAEFWGQVLRVKNLQFLLLLLLPFFPGALNRPWLLGAGALLLGFNFIRNSEEIVNLAQQYQVENIAMFAVALVLGVRRVKPGNRLPRLLSWRLTAPKLKNTRMAMIAGTMACALFSHYFFAETFYNKANLMRIINLADVRDAVDEMKTLIPPGETLDADLFVAPMFLFRNPLYGVDHKAEKFLAYHVVDSVMSFPFARHGEILRDPDWEQIWHKSLDDGRVLFLFRRVETPAKVGQKSPLPPKRNSTEPATTTPQISHYFDIAIHPDKTGSKIEFRLRRPLRGFARIYLRIIFPDNTTTQRNFFFADAALAPEQMPVGSKYELALPWSAEEISSAKLQFILRIL